MDSKTFSEGLVSLVKFSNRFIYSETSSCKTCKPFFIEGHQVGLVRPDVIKELTQFPETFQIIYGSGEEIEKILLSPTLTNFDARTAAVAEVLNQLRKKECFVALKGWRNEDFNVCSDFSEPPLMKMERTATALFGIKQYGTHIIGYTHDEEKGVCVWTGQRSLKKPTFPGKLDNMVGGGLASGQSAMDCARKEGQEEASVGEDLLKKLKPTGTISYFYEDERGVFPEIMFVMDLEVPRDFEPRNSDGEVERFYLHTIKELKELIIGESFKFNCAMANLDFLIRHGYITPDEEPNYTFLVENLHRTLF